jgi:glycosyltransferase involved in cell wall biosynthesis
MTAADEPRARVAFLIGNFPVPSQRFILREVLAVRALGAEVEVYAVRHPAADWLDAREREVLGAVRAVPGILSWSSLRAHAYFLRRNPRRYGATLGAMLRMPRRRWYLVFRHADAFLRAPWVARSVLTSRGSPHVHAHFALRATELAVAVAGLTGGTYSFTAHAYDIYREPSGLEAKIRGARFVVTCTRVNAEYLRGLCPDVPPDRIRLVYHGVEAEPQADAPSRPAEPGPPLVLTAGRLVEKKGFDVFIEASAALVRRGVTFRAAIVGDGPLRKRLAAQIEAGGLGGHIQLLGWQSYRDLVALYREAAVFALPSRIAGDGDRDGIPNVLVEALRYRVPVVSTAVSAIPEVVRNGETGWLVPPDDPAALAEALATALGDPASARVLASAGQEFVAREFDPARNASRLLAMFPEGSAS